MREWQGETDKQRSAPFWTSKRQSDYLHAKNERVVGGNSQADISPFWISQWQSDHLHTINERAIGWKKQMVISTILNSPMTIRPLTSYHWESNKVKQTWQDHHYFEFPNDNQNTYFLWVIEQQDGTDRERSAQFWIHQCQSDHLLAINERATGWDRQAEISIILNSPMTIRQLTHYKWESNKVEQTGRDQHHPEFPNNSQTTYKLWMGE